QGRRSFRWRVRPSPSARAAAHWGLHRKSSVVAGRNRLEKLFAWSVAYRGPVRRHYLTLVAVCTFWGTIPLIVRDVHVPAAAIVSVRLWVAAFGLGAVR